MSVCAMLEGRRLYTKLADGCLADADSHARRTDAEHGSLMLRNAILRAKGYQVPVVRLVPPPPPAPVFHRRKVKLGAPKKRKPRIFRENPKIAQIQALVANHFNLMADEITGNKRVRKVSHPRQIAMYLSRQATAVSYPNIAKQFGGKDHTTVIHAVRQVEKRIADKDRETLEALNAVHAVIGA